MGGGGREGDGLVSRSASTQIKTHPPYPDINVSATTAVFQWKLAAVAEAFP